MKVIVCVLFSSSGFEEKIIKLVESYNDGNPDFPILLIEPTEQLFGNNYVKL